MKSRKNVCYLVNLFLLSGLIILVVMMTFYKININKPEVKNPVSTQNISNPNIELVSYQTFNYNLQDVYTSLNIAHSYFYSADLNIIPDMELKVKINNSNGESENEIWIEAWFLGNIPLNNDDVLVDAISDKSGAIVTLFQRIDQGFISISTSFIDDNSIRKTGILIANDSMVAKAINEGRTYVEQVQLGENEYINAYEPILHNGLLIGILSISLPVDNPGYNKTI